MERVDRAPPGTGVEGTTKDEGRGTCMQPPPEEAFPHGEGGSPQARRMRGRFENKAVG